jgi:hypothetical protein
VPHSDISIVANNRDDPAVTDRHGDHGTGAATGATAGALIGGGAGLLAGIGALAIPGIGPVVAAGWLVATLAGAVTGGAAGAATGGLIGSLTNSGVPEREAHVYAEGVRRGGSLVTVRTDDARALEVERIMDATRPLDWTERDREQPWLCHGDDTAAAPNTKRLSSQILCGDAPRWCPARASAWILAPLKLLPIRACSCLRSRELSAGDRVNGAV